MTSLDPATKISEISVEACLLCLIRLGSVAASETLNEKAPQMQGFSDLERAKGIEPSS
jgi:hypothetical protein